ncbi:hypothetical protein [Corynebacterium aquatimens]|uniref:hypothetical protein n=1 Tax=Corynebacterium aquatimens TaxID=1190508 RepID=UPI003EBA9245
MNVPLGEILAGQMGTEPPAGTVFVCASGVRSAQAVAALQARGFTGLASLRGDWAASRTLSCPRRSPGTR